ncbi:hypothetical protein GTY65_34130 [Streptomyces sp. SID8379]|nr:hypothetical protein [Streptomyces sp. SID8379]MYW69076.1 hypothetical protein [Streptomyces sp. SID8379]
MPEAPETPAAPAIPEGHRELISDLSGIVSDYPYADPEPTLRVLVGDAADAVARLDTPEGRRERAGYTVLLHATCWYAAARIFDKSLHTSYAETLERIRDTLDPAACPCPADIAHPENLDPEYAVEVGVSLLSEGGRAAFIEDYGIEAEELTVLDCDGYLAELADTAAGHMREAYRENFGSPDVSHLDAEFVREDGTIDIGSVQASIARTWEHNTGPVALWSTRRWLSGRFREEERLGLFLCLWMGTVQTYEGLPPSYARELKAAVRTVDLDATCDHPKHPWSVAARSTDTRRRAVLHLYAPQDQPETPVPAELSARELWECPVQYAELAHEALRDIEGWRTMRGGADEDWDE